MIVRTDLEPARKQIFEVVVFPKKFKRAHYMPARFRINSGVYQTPDSFGPLSEEMLHNCGWEIEETILIAPKAPGPVNIFEIHEKSFIHGTDLFNRRPTGHKR